MSTPTPATATPTAAGLARAVPYAKATATFTVSLFSLLLQGIYTVLAFTAHPIMIIVLSPAPLFLYLLAPLFIVIQLALDTLVYTPLRLVSYLADALYPVYVLVGVACITGGILGLSGRVLVQWGLGTTPSIASEAVVWRRKLS
ncbi:hypothetical protein C8F01DRAFT_1373024 [Mycena amicta]|nr:hypothetical protein C8F01DRAFT_1373024 [Mycena amicta]